MKVKELYEKLGTLLQLDEENYGNLEVVTVNRELRDKVLLGATPTHKIDRLVMGFDWDADKLFLAEDKQISDEDKAKIATMFNQNKEK